MDSTDGRFISQAQTLNITVNDPCLKETLKLVSESLPDSGIVEYTLGEQALDYTFRVTKQVENCPVELQWLVTCNDSDCFA